MPVLSTGELKDHPQPKCHLRIAQVFLFAKEIMTHPFIKSKMLRKAYARELWEARPLLKVMPICERLSLRLGIESGIWAVQKVILQDMQ